MNWRPRHPRARGRAPRSPDPTPRWPDRTGAREKLSARTRAAAVTSKGPTPGGGGTPGTRHRPHAGLSSREGADTGRHRLHDRLQQRAESAQTRPAPATAHSTPPLPPHAVQRGTCRDRCEVARPSAVASARPTARPEPQFVRFAPHRLTPTPQTLRSALQPQPSRHDQPRSLTIA